MGSGEAGGIIREGTMGDLDHITAIDNPIFPLDAQGNYRYLYREQYPEAHYERYKQRWA